MDKLDKPSFADPFSAYNTPHTTNQTVHKGSQTTTLKRFQAYHIDYLANYQSIGSYAAAKGLTYETAKHRLQTAEKVHDLVVSSNHTS